MTDNTAASDDPEQATGRAAHPKITVLAAGDGKDPVAPQRRMLDPGASARRQGIQARHGARPGHARAVIRQLIGASRDCLAAVQLIETLAGAEPESVPRIEVYQMDGLLRGDIAVKPVETAFLSQARGHSHENPVTGGCVQSSLRV